MVAWTRIGGLDGKGAWQASRRGRGASTWTGCRGESRKWSVAWQILDGGEEHAGLKRTAISSGFGGAKERYATWGVGRPLRGYAIQTLGIDASVELGRRGTAPTSTSGCRWDAGFRRCKSFRPEGFRRAGSATAMDAPAEADCTRAGFWPALSQTTNLGPLRVSKASPPPQGGAGPVDHRLLRVADDHLRARLKRPAARRQHHLQPDPVRRRSGFEARSRPDQLVRRDLRREGRNGQCTPNSSRLAGRRWAARRRWPKTRQLRKLVGLDRGGASFRLRTG